MSGSNLSGGSIFLSSISELVDKLGIVKDYLLKNQKNKVKQIFNNFLEEFYNKNGEDEMRIVKHYFLK